MARGEASRARESCDFLNQVRSPSALVRGPRCRVPSLASFARGTAHSGTQQEPATETSAMIPSMNFARGFAACLAALMWGGIGTASALDYPTRPVRWIVPYTPGGGTDITARIMAQWLSERLGQQFIIENKPGAGNNIGTEAAIHSPPDGYTLLLVNPANAINATLYPKLSF